MYGMNYSGGDNRTHGQLERAERIDSFEAAKVRGWGMILTSRMLPLDCEVWPDGAELSAGPWSAALGLARIPSGFGGSRAFWLCPSCGRRARFLYFKSGGFVCRKCARLNYAVQQRTKSSINHAHDGLRLAQEKLHWELPFPIAPMDFPHVVPDRPRYMHRTTYFRLLARYMRYQEKYRRDSLREMLAILRR